MLKLIYLWTNTICFSRSGSRSLVNLPLEEEKTVRSTRLLERRSKKRRMPKSEVMIHETYSSRNVDVKRKIREGFDPNDPLRLFLWGPETKQLLTADEESKLIAQVQVYFLTPVHSLQWG